MRIIGRGRRPKRKKRINSVMKRNLIIVFMGVLCLCAFLIGRLIYLNNTKGEQYAKAVLSQQAYSSHILPAERGSITDRNGIVLARSEKVYNVVLDPKVIQSQDYFVEPTIEALVMLLGYDEQDIRRILSEYSTSSYVVYEKDVEYYRVSDFNKYKAAHKYVVGVWFEEEYKRRYPYNNFASHILGFVDKDGGRNGLEQYYNNVLEGVDGLQYGYFDSELNSRKTIKEAEQGKTIVSTIDYNIQSVVQKQVDNFNKEIGSKNIGVIVMNPNNGEIYGMASNQEYDLNNPRSLDMWYTQEEQEEMDQDERMNRIYWNWRNFCISDTYEPGSTFKTVTVASALEEAAVSPLSSFCCNGYTEVGGWRISCAMKKGHGWLDLEHALMKSCNCALMEIADLLGSESFYRYQRYFGFGSKTGIDLTGEADGIIIPRSKLNSTELATSSFGTTFNVSMIQMASAYCSMINGGTYYTPHVVKEICNSDGTVVSNFENLELRQTVSKETSDFIRKALLSTVLEGTATAAKVPGYKIAGKTGTAQKHPRSEKKYTVSFMGFAPADNPQLLVYVVLDEINDPELAGSSRPANEMAGRIFTEVLPYLGIYPENEEINYVTDPEVLEAIKEEEQQEYENVWDVLPEGLEGSIDESGEDGASMERRPKM